MLFSGCMFMTPSKVNEKNKKVVVYSVLFFVFILLLTLYFCVASFVTSYGYGQAMKAKEHEKQVLTSLSEPKIFTIVIDPGHGGEDPGAVANGVIEKHLDLSIGLKLTEFLNLSASDVVLTRTEDILLYEPGQEKRKKFYDLRNRLELAQGVPNGVYVGIHMNKFPIEKYFGLQTFYSDNNPKSRVFADIVQETCRLVDPENNRKIKPDGNTIFILENIEIPAILIECGFLSNYREAMLLADEGYQKKLAFLIFCGVERFLYEESQTS